MRLNTGETQFYTMASMQFSDQQLQAYLDESLATEAMSAIEQCLRTDEGLRERLVDIAGQREAGVHGLGEIWRRNRLSCPDRQQLGSYLLGAMDEAFRDYIQFHVATVGCRLCQANLHDLQSQSTEQQAVTQSRRRRYFQTSAGYLGGKSQE
jgi:anti-sigma factor RsiW